VSSTRLLSLSLAAALAAPACGSKGGAPATATLPSPSESGAPAGPAAAPGAAPAASARFKLDESKLPPVTRFTRADTDPARPACTDLFEHVNGAWLASTQIPGDRTTWGAAEMLIERSLGIQQQLAEQAAARPDAQGVEKIVGDLYATGLDEATINQQGLEPLQGRLQELDALRDRAGVADLIRRWYATGDGYLFQFGPESDFAAPDMAMAYAMQAGLGLPDKTYYVDKDKKDKLAAYERHVARVLELSGVPAKQAATQARSVVAFESRLARASKSQEEISRDVSLFYNPVTPAEADKLTPNFPWTKFFAAQGLPADGKFSLAIPAFHKEVNKLLGSAPLAQWKSYLRFHLVDSWSPFLSDPFVEENFNFYAKTLRGQKELRARWKRVLDTVNGQAGEALGQLYVEVAFSPQAKARMQELVKNLSVALKGRLEKLEWMSPETKKKAMEKWATFTPKIGYPDKWRDWSGLETSRESYLGNVMAAAEFNYRWELSKVGKPIDKTEWSLRPQTVNANYNPLQNEITFPAAILQPPFFDLRADDALNYGGIGAVIGHEMTHGYDDQGSRFGASGRFENWWTAEDAKGFDARKGQLVAQFDAYEVAPGKKVNGKLTLGENIADLGGLAVAFDALQRATEGQPDANIEGMSREQRLFANWATVWRRTYTPEELAVRLVADPHAPAHFRAIGAPSNLESFARAYGCKDGDKMVRSGDNRIVIW
jgi:putative endopeptidase